MKLESISILYEDDDMLFVNKPAGLVVHPDGKTEESSLTEWMLARYPDTKEVGEPIVAANGTIVHRPGIVHRLDRDTSGVIVLAKNTEAFQSLKEQFQARTIEKIYHAFVYGSIKADKGVIDRPIGRSSKDFRMWSAQRGARGEMREAVTEYAVLDRRPDCSFVEVYPRTGRTHQIRVHFKAINFPLVCDRLYAPKREGLLGFNRLALHARKLKVIDRGGRPVTVEAPYPADFENALRGFKASLAS